MSDTLKDLLTGLAAGPAAPSPIEGFERLDGQSAALEKSATDARRRLESYRAATKLLDHLLRTSSFDEEMARLDYPSRLLKGPIDLGSAAQRGAVAELSVTLDRDQRVPERSRTLMRALQMFYHDYFDAEGRPPREDGMEERRLRDFQTDPDRGANPAWQEWRRYNQALDAAEADPARIADLDGCRPAFHTEVHARRLAESRNPGLKRHLLEAGAWTPAHRGALERYFVLEADPALLAATLRVMRERAGGAREAFLDAQLASEDKASLITEFLKEGAAPDALKEMLRRAVREGHIHLFTVLTHLVGYDPRWFYFSLKDDRLPPEIFRSILDALFIPFSAQESYGMDTRYAEKVFEKQRTIPMNVLRVLQKVMPRGLDEAPLPVSFGLLADFGEEFRRLFLERQAYDAGQKPKDHAYMELMLRLSAVDAIRFVIFTFVFDRLTLSLKLGRPLGLPEERLREVLARQKDFERACGRNANIVAYADALLAKLDERAPAEVPA